MKVEFECHNCHKSYPVTPPGGFHPNADRTTIVGLCAACAEISYGPLTEAMLADAMIAVADRWYNDVGHPGPAPMMQSSLAKAEARFVLRLLGDLSGYIPTDDDTGFQWPDGLRCALNGCDWRSWLSNMMGQS